MIILIGGPSCMGKTKLAQELMKKTAMPYFSIDLLKMGLYRSDKNCSFTPLDQDEKIAIALWPILREMMMTAIENKRNMIFEGSYLLPDLIRTLPSAYLEEIKPVFLGFSEDYLRKNFKRGVLAFKGIIEDRPPEDERGIDFFIKASQEVKTACEENDLPFYEINTDYQIEMEAIKTDVIGKLKIGFLEKA